MGNEIKKYLALPTLLLSMKLASQSCEHGHDTR